mmetsp:Transcript_16890/g.38724  ORF Transcript_16890/g.38724 Transcript_16890/m.38724 type:complete len:216 (+) Transcript_16890:115-762(+)|eukprot:CAMPEP_0172398602 /NCGR_PEP_ID=MMETSP1061-20121228/37124_1 /TAXON_ID=37318 /ORGANISM="Pseudo-nitzschia pungens, Strain cf. pungens" /LENGTH=215 /DNA_ID=CAMNT_0013131191 /DNA_START=49 /DNA_END=696 /DNA_ORIENTATION=+
MDSANPTPAKLSCHPAGGTAATQEEQERPFQEAILKLIVLAVGTLSLLKALAASIKVYVGLLPIVYIYGLQTCPPASSFDAKQELRAVFRGDPLPQDHPEKPKGGMLAQFLADAKATIASELVTLPGYEVTITSLAGAASLATVTMPTVDAQYLWVGWNHRWYYYGARTLSETNQSDVGVSNNREGTNVYKAPESVDIKIGKTNIKLDFGKGKQD